MPSCRFATMPSTSRLADGAEEVDTATNDVLKVAEPLGTPRDDLPKPPLPRDERPGAEVIAVDREQVEGVHDGFGTAEEECAEVGAAVVIQAHQLAVEHRR